MDKDKNTQWVGNPNNTSDIGYDTDFYDNEDETTKSKQE